MMQPKLSELPRGEVEAQGASQMTSIEALTTELANAREALNTLHGELKAMASRLKDTEDLNLTLQTLLEEAQVVQNVSVAELKALQDQLVEQERTAKKLNELSRAHEKMGAHYEATKVLLGETKEKLARLSKMHEATKQAAIQRSQELLAVREALNDVLRSGSWRLTAPYRQARTWVSATFRSVGPKSLADEAGPPG